MLPSSKFGGTCPPQGIFALQKSLRVGCDGGRGSSSQSRQSPRKEISRGNLLCAESGLTSLSYPRLQSVQKHAGTLNWYNRPYRAAWGARGAAAPLFPKESRENPFKGFLWAISSRRLDTALLCAAKKRGVESPGWQASSSLSLALAATDGKSKKEGRLSPPKPLFHRGTMILTAL